MLEHRSERLSMRPQGRERLTIELLEDHGSLVTRWTGRFENGRLVPTCLRTSEIGAVRKQFAKDLQEVKDILGKRLRPSWPQLNSAIQHLLQVGDQLSFDLFGANRRRVDNLWRKNCVECFQERMPLPIINIWGYSDFFLPFEFLRCFYDPRRSTLNGKYPTISNIDQLNQALRQFLGFSCIVKRIHHVAGAPRANSPGVGRNLLYSGCRLPMKLFLNRRLSGVREEEQQLSALQELDISAWPNLGKPASAEELALELWNAHRSPGKRRKKVFDQVHHFASHYNTGSKDHTKHSFGLAACSQSKLTATIGDLNRVFARLSTEGFPSPRNRPLVFVNACGTAKIDPNQVHSLPKLFVHKLASRGFIGTETTMSDSVAAEFSYRFYERFLGGSRLGESLHDTRWWLVRRYRNPLGLFYTNYSDPNLLVQLNGRAIKQQRTKGDIR